MLRRFLRRHAADSRIWILLAVIGPGIITANADNDATGILGYSQAGAQYQYALLWVLVVSGLALGVCQEINARMGAVTGKGFADLIRENYGVRITVFAMVALLVANFTTTVAEFAGILAAIQAFTGPSVRFVVIPVTAAAVWWMVARGSYQRFERILLAASLIYFSYVISAFLAHPPWGEVLRQTVWPDLRRVFPLRAYVFMVINVVGTTITPWGQFYIQSSIRDKGLTLRDYSITRLEVYFSAFWTQFVGYFIIVACGTTLYTAGVRNIEDAGQAALALAPLAGKLASLLFAIGLFNASCFGAIVVPLSTAYAVTEALGWESGLGRRTREAPLFIGTYTVLILAAALLVLLFPRHLASLMILPNIVGGVLLPIVLVLMLRLVNDRRIMGEYTNSWRFNVVAWTTTLLMIVLSLTLLFTSLIPGLAG
ncbi:MAG: NRAMP family divalent metal transporter [Chthonomonadales bacterium]